jgi:hypothetical protein
MNMRFTIIAYCTINAKATPHNVEATIFAVLTGLNNFAFGFVASRLGAFIATGLGI